MIGVKSILIKELYLFNENGYITKSNASFDRKFDYTALDYKRGVQVTVVFPELDTDTLVELSEKGTDHEVHQVLKPKKGLTEQQLMLFPPCSKLKTYVLQIAVSTSSFIVIL
jgi:hypothetical protein